MLKTIIKKEMLLQFKFDSVLDFLSKKPVKKKECPCKIEPIIFKLANAEVSGDMMNDIADPSAFARVTANICDHCTSKGNDFNVVVNVNDSITLNVHGIPRTFKVTCPSSHQLQLTGLADLAITGPMNDVGNRPFTAIFDETANSITIFTLDDNNNPIVIVVSNNELEVKITNCRDK